MYSRFARRAPAVEASLIAYLWPLLIVLLSAIGGPVALVSTSRARCWGWAARPLIVTGGRGVVPSTPAPGHGIALLAAFIWAGYSVAQRRYAQVPTQAVAGFCLGDGSFWRGSRI